MSRMTAVVVLMGWLLCGHLPLAWADQDSASISEATAEREVLVMLRLPPPHFRPDANYVGGYTAQSGRAARLRIAKELAARFNLRIIDSWPMRMLGVECFVMEVTGKTEIGPLIEQMEMDARVESVQSMKIFNVLSHDDPLYPLQPTAVAWHLQELHQVATGRTVRVAEIDSGVELDHPDLRGRVLIERNFVDGRGAVAESHGTAVAGIIGARADDGLGIAGVAPDAGLMALRACWQSATGKESAVCSTFTLAKALQFAIDNGAKVINLSLSGPNDRLLRRLMEVAESRGVVIVAAADPRFADGGFPASFPGVLAVAGDDEQYLSAAILLAPGRDIPTTMVGKRWGFVNGSSFAAAQVTGLVALLFDLAPHQTPQQIRQNLNSPETPASSPGHNAIVDACAAVRRTAGVCTCECSVARVGISTPVR